MSDYDVYNNAMYFDGRDEQARPFVQEWYRRLLHMPVVDNTPDNMTVLWASGNMRRFYHIWDGVRARAAQRLFEAEAISPTLWPLQRQVLQAASARADTHVINMDTFLRIERDRRIVEARAMLPVTAHTTAEYTGAHEFWAAYVRWGEAPRDLASTRGTAETVIIGRPPQMTPEDIERARTFRSGLLYILQQNHIVAFMQAWHPRLGEASPVATLNEEAMADIIISTTFGIRPPPVYSDYEMVEEDHDADGG